MSDKIDSTEVGGFWDKLFYLVKLITGDVKISTKGTLQNQIDEMSTKVDDCFTSVGDGKKAVASAITDKGVTTAQNAEFATMAANVRKIKTNPTLQAKAITLDTSKTTQTLTPDPGYDGLSQVKASITTQTKSVNLSTSEQVVKPDSGKVLSQVTVPAVTGSAGLKDVVAGKTFNSATAGVDKTGTLLDKRGTTVDAAAVDQDDNYTYFTVPTEAVYDAKSKLRTLSSNLGSNRLLYVANLNASGLSTTDMFSTIATDPNDIITLSDKNIVINQSGSLKIVISGNGNVTSGNAAIKINGSLVLSVSGTSANNSKTINVSKGDIITGSCYAGSYGGYMNNRITMYYEP